MRFVLDKYTALELEAYNGKEGVVYSLKEGWIKDEKFTPTFCKRTFKGEEKTAPLSVKIGDKAKVIEITLALLHEVTGRDYAPQGKDDVPF